MSTIGVNPPMTPVTEGSDGKAPATAPNVCKMPGPPPPFVPTPLPNLGQSSDSLSGGTTNVLFEGKKVAIKGSSFKSTPSGDAASQGTGGGIVSSQTQGKTEWVAPGSMDVKAEGKNIQLLGDTMTNNGGSPANSLSVKELQGVVVAQANLLEIKCADAPAKGNRKFTKCEKLQICAKCEDVNKQAAEGKLKKQKLSEKQKLKRRRKGNNAADTFKARLGNSLKGFGSYGKKLKKPKTPAELGNKFTHQCSHEEWMAEGSNPDMPGLSADHIQELQLGGSPVKPSNLRLMSSYANEWIGSTLKKYKPDVHTGVAPDCCG